MEHLLEKAITLAAEAHAGQKTKSGRPYILHPLHLMAQMETEGEMITAVLHDVVEDTPLTITDLQQQGFPQEILTALDLLTHPSHLSYETYIARLKPNSLARRVKLADLEHNMDLRRLPRVRPRDLRRLEKYHRAWQTLRAESDGDR